MIMMIIFLVMVVVVVVSIDVDINVGIKILPNNNVYSANQMEKTKINNELLYLSTIMMIILLRFIIPRC